MTRRIDVAFRQEDAVLERAGSAAVIDTLRATTTMTVILERGAAALRPVADLALAYQLREHDPEILLGGERQNRPPEGFDGGNSPYDWPAERVQGRRVVFTTTNGTKAVERVRSVDHVVLAALINAEAVGRYLWDLERPALLVAAGSRGETALEDVLTAGAVASYWPRPTRTDAAEIACALYERERKRLDAAVIESNHGQDLERIGLIRDLEFAARLNVTQTVPVLGQDGWLRAAE